MSIWERGGSHYEIVLALVIAVLALTPVDTGATRPLIVALLGAVFLFSFWTSGASRHVVLIAAVLVIAAVTVAAVGQFAGGRPARIVFTAAGAALSAGAIATIFGQLTSQSRVTRRTVTGALSVYLLIGLLFTYVFAFIGVVNSAGFFAQSGEHDATDYVYFSYITLTTVGYGDLTAGTNVGRVLAAMEALVGQLYLVTIVAVVIANIGRERSPQRSPRRRSRVADTELPESDLPGANEPRIVPDE
jgi:ion channel